jgi:septin 7
MENKGIGVSNLPNLLHNEFRKRPCNLNILVIGPHGIGKTTFMNRLVGSHVFSKQPFESTENNPFWYLEADCNIHSSSIEVCDSNFVTKLNVVEVDGFGDQVDNTGCYKPIVELIESRFDDYKTQIKEKTALHIEDNRFHICFFFLEPIFSINECSIEALKKLSPLCTVIPVIGKSDLVNSDLDVKLKTFIRRTLEENGVSGLNEYTNEWPFLLFSECRDPSTGVEEAKLWRDTTFQSHQTNDFNVLRRLVIEKHAYQLIKDTDQFYDNYRITRLLQQTTDNDIKEAKGKIEAKIVEYQEEIRELQLKMQQESVN